ncbi:hypothetical protein [uncultured Friedmanniella sp.]|uniref:hypothetical protein n=1 Tax=uncultured Friedmanniella sp. TaxID=335381 RepID=UPI0035C97CC3
MRRGSLSDTLADPLEGWPGESTSNRPPEAPRNELQTEFSFVLPRGYVDGAGTLHRDGVMRLATARDELVPLRDDRVRENPAYLTVVLLARVLVRIGSIEDVHAGLVENLFAADLAFLQDLYRRVNTEGHTRAAVTCPACEHRFAVDVAGGRLGE